MILILYKNNTLHTITVSFNFFTSGLNYKPMTIIKDDSRVITKLETSLTDDARVIIYDRHMFIVQATEFHFVYLFSAALYSL
jgi:hypothetical protein